MTNTTRKLYHFTANRFLNGIKVNGISRGVTPVKLCGQTAFIARHQWLTTSNSFIQSWEKNSTLSYRRNEARLEVRIPKDYAHRIICMTELEDRFGNYLLEDFFTGADRENWRIYSGVINTSWIKSTVYKPKNQGDFT